MDEKYLLLLALLGTIAGIFGLFFLPELPKQEFEGTITWSNSTHAWLIKEEKYWVEFENQSNKTGCVSLQGRINNNRISKAVLFQDDQQCRPHRPR